MKSSPRFNNNDINAHYVRHIKSMPILTVDEEYQLAKKWREEGDRVAVEKLVSSHLRLVAKIASGYRGYGLPISDLISEGNLGMMHAMKHFDPDRGFRLSTYAIWWVKAAIQEYILHSWSLVKIGTTAAQKKLFFNLRKEKRLFNENEELYLTPEQIAKIALKLGVKETEVIEMNQRIASQDHSLNAPIRSAGDSDSEWVDWISDDRDNQEVVTVERDELTKRRKLLDQAMEHLTQREQEIIINRRLKEPSDTLEELSVKLNISRERVRQIEVKAFEKLQKAIKRLAKTKFDNI
ncbi:RNA polymerase sigma factor RpoH [Candidatus Paracaedibacter symbiosus]|uniref:RNA polymerase sigma factor RpoH n=1 Tax=Candidatus Paracaedibacter symbiosus TaxID=244582 RepID=UPI0005097EC1|nr:RNA polymerase sigma factor RpoH [Candidatus Paracaedibacter symbiosus]